MLVFFTTKMIVVQVRNMGKIKCRCLIRDIKLNFAPCYYNPSNNMKKIQILSFLVVIYALVTACQTATTADTNSFGAGVSKQDNPMAFADMVKQLDTQDSLNVVVKAKVSEVCQTKGCWMNLVDNQSQTDEQLFVKFKDYAFFVPKDISGKEVLIEGVAYREETTVDELRHYAEDAGKSAEEIAAITEPVQEKKFMASGVVLLK